MTAQDDKEVSRGDLGKGTHWIRAGNGPQHLAPQLPGHGSMSLVTAPGLEPPKEPHPAQGEGLCGCCPQVRQGQIIRLVREQVPRSSWTQDKQEGGSQW